jgi:hypothetical protein
MYVNNGSSATSVRYTGQRQESSLDGIYYYGSRWYDGYDTSPHNQMRFRYC